MALGIVGLVAGSIGAIVSITQYDLGPDWCPIALALTGLSLTLLGGALYRGKGA